MNPRSRESPVNDYVPSIVGHQSLTSNGYIMDKQSNQNLSEDEENAVVSRKRVCDNRGSVNSSGSVAREKVFRNSQDQEVHDRDVITCDRIDIVNSGNGGFSVIGKEKDRSNRWSNVVMQPNQNNLSQVNVESLSDRICATDIGPPPIADRISSEETNSEYPDYLT